ncbi:MAG: hypothetical protein WB505_12670 [Pseudolabrys sp.]
MRRTRDGTRSKRLGSVVRCVKIVPKVGHSVFLGSNGKISSCRHERYRSRFAGRSFGAGLLFRLAAGICVERGGNVFVPGRNFFVYRVVANQVTLILKTTRSQYGSPFNDSNDYVVLNDGHVIGRIMLQPQAPQGRPWFWTITDMEYPRTIHSRGYSATFEEAMKDFKTQWLTADRIHLAI